MMHDVAERLHQYEFDGKRIASRQLRYLREIIRAPTQLDPRQFNASSHAMPNVAQDEIEVTLDRLGAVDEKSQFHENFADAAFDIGQAEIVGRKMGKQCCEAGADAVRLRPSIFTTRSSAC
jgi:hypothetical protein